MSAVYHDRLVTALSCVVGAVAVAVGIKAVQGYVGAADVYHAAVTYLLVLPVGPTTLFLVSRSYDRRLFALSGIVYAVCALVYVHGIDRLGAASALRQVLAPAPYDCVALMWFVALFVPWLVLAVRKRR